MRQRFSLGLGALLLTAGSLPAQQKVELLFTGSFLGERAWPKTGEKWLGLYRTASGFRLAPTKIKVERVPDACAGTATRISADMAEEPYLLVRGHDSFGLGLIDTALAGNEFLYPGQSISVRFGKPEHWYYMLALGSASARPGDILFTDYRLELRDSEHPGSGQVFLKFDRLALENIPNLQWAGDLDRDGRLDLLFRVPIGGHSKRYVLFLSSAASRPKLVKVVASFDLLDC
ncbi:MAG: hypothetical protein ACJ8BF_12680 [Gemmatimonadales bacterium]